MKQAIVSIEDRSPPPPRFCRAAFAVAQAEAKGGQPEEYLGRDATPERLIIQRATALPGSTAESGWAAELAHNAYGNFLEEIAPYSGAASLISRSVKADLSTALPRYTPGAAARQPRRDGSRKMRRSLPPRAR